MAESFRAKVVARYQERYADFGPKLACEKLAEDGFDLSPDTLSTLLKERGLWFRRRHRGRHRKRRERKSCFGEMLQMDGSIHDWFENRGPRCVLMVLIDDATSRCYARFYLAESLSGSFDVFGRWLKRHGIPRSVYVDRHSIYRDDDHPDKPTQFGRAMKELGVELIHAHSPQAKGRVERRNGVFQDRLVKEMRLRGISSMDEANTFLEEFFLPDMNLRFSNSPAVEADVHRVVPVSLVLEEVLCVQESRVVSCDWCVRWRNRWLQVSSKHAELSLPGRQVLVRELAGGSLLVNRGETRLEATEIGCRPAKPKKKKKVIMNNRNWKPGDDHPWRRGLGGPQVIPASAAPSRGLPAGEGI